MDFQEGNVIGTYDRGEDEAFARLMVSHVNKVRDKAKIPENWLIRVKINGHEAAQCAYANSWERLLVFNKPYIQKNILNSNAVGIIADEMINGLIIHELTHLKRNFWKNIRHSIMKAGCVFGAVSAEIAIGFMNFISYDHHNNNVRPHWYNSMKAMLVGFDSFFKRREEFACDNMAKEAGCMIGLAMVLENMALKEMCNEPEILSTSLIQGKSFEEALQQFESAESEKYGWVKRVLETHPPSSERIRRLTGEAGRF